MAVDNTRADKLLTKVFGPPFAAQSEHEEKEAPPIIRTLNRRLKKIRRMRRGS